MPSLPPERAVRGLPPAWSGDPSSEQADIDLLHRISAELLYEGDGSALYQRLVDVAVGIMHSDLGSMQMRSDETGESRLILLAHRNFSEESARLWANVPGQPASTCGLALEHRTRVISCDVQHDSRITGQGRQTYLKEGIAAAQSTPLLTRDGRTVGVLSTHWRTSYQPSDHQLRLFDILARQAADFLDRVQSEGELREREAWLSSQKEAMQAALGDMPLADCLGVLARMVVARLDHGVRAAFYLSDSQGTTLHHVVGMGEEYAALVDGFRVGPESLACGLATAMGEPVITPDVQGEPGWQPWLWLAQRFDYRGCWSFPITTSSGAFVGMFALYWPEPRSPTQRHLQLADHITRTAAIIISRDAESNERRRGEDALREADRRKDEFLAMLAHELRNPLSAISNASHTLSRLAESPEASQCSAIIDRQAGLLGELVDDLLDVSRITRGLITLREEPCNLQEIVYRAVATLQPLVDEKRQDVQIGMPSRVAWVTGDPARLEQIVLNLLGNAIKYTDCDGRIRLDVAFEDDGVSIRVKDQGIGIAPDTIGHVFDLFSQAERGLARSQGGLGIGLTVVRRLVQLHGGEVAAHSDGLGKGSEFVVRLPLGKAAGAVAAASAQSARHGAASGGQAARLRILIVEDRKDCADSMALLLRMAEHDVRIANDGAGALQSAGAWHPDVVLMDLGLPDMDGYEVARRIRGSTPVGEVRLIAISGYGQEQDLERSRLAGFDAHFRKPVDIPRLMESLV